MVLRRSSPGPKTVFSEDLSTKHHEGFTSDEPQGRHADFSEKLWVDPVALNSPRQACGSLGDFSPPPVCLSVAFPLEREGVPTEHALSTILASLSY